MEEDEDGLFSTVSRALECVEGWCAHWSPECLRAVLGDDASPSTSGEDDDDVRARALADALLVAARRAAPAILAVERFARERRARCGGASTTVVELCGASRGHLLGALIASMRLEGVARVVLVDPRWPRAGAGDDASGDAAGAAASVPKKTDDARLPTAHMDARTDGWWTHRLVDPPHRWKASAKNASHLRSLAAALRRARVAEPGAFPGAVAIVANGVGGTGDLRALQLYHAPYGNRTLDPLTTDVNLADADSKNDDARCRARDVPRRSARARHEARRRNPTYRAGPSHEFSVKRLWPGRYVGVTRRRASRRPDPSTRSRGERGRRTFASAPAESVSSLELRDGFHERDSPLVTARGRARARWGGVPRGCRGVPRGGTMGVPMGVPRGTRSAPWLCPSSSNSRR